jgi:hypothetical protein
MAHRIWDSPHSLLSKCACMEVVWVCNPYRLPILTLWKDHILDTWFSYWVPTASLCSGSNRLDLLPFNFSSYCVGRDWPCTTPVISSVSPIKWICLILTMILPYFSDSNVVSSFSSPCYPFTTSRGFGGKDPKQGWKGDGWSMDCSIIRVWNVDWILVLLLL